MIKLTGGNSFPGLSAAWMLQSTYRGSVERIRSEASCDSRTTAICDCGPDPGAGIYSVSREAVPTRQSTGLTG